MKLLTVLLTVLMFVFTTNEVYALPENENKADNNPQVVSYYPGPNDVHGIVGESETHTGSDLVMRAGGSGVFQQWFLGESASEGTHGEHSVWVPANNGTCPNGWVYIADPNPIWGTHFPDNTDYCVHTNDYALGS